jgi:biotin operon repressor/anti-sigma regulatory factor (Ser/Thr protein kinase)
MDTKKRILKYLEDKEFVTGKELSEFLGISRQATNKHLKQLIQNGSMVKDGTTKGAVYTSPSHRKRVQSVRRFEKTFSLLGLEEDKVFHELASFLNLRHELSTCASDIANYAFTEILNNAIEHSASGKCLVTVSLDHYNFNFRIRDFGIGIFHSIAAKFGLSDENAAIGELIKGKTTTMKEKHTGEGIFFTSKSADVVLFRSHKINLIFDNLKRDVFVEERKFTKGTEVAFSVSKRSKRRLDKLFTHFAPEEFDYRFERTRVLVRLFHKDYVSRSEAKRLLHGLDKFKEIILDFEGVKSIGQGFADEIFRVFRKAHPGVTVKTENLSPTLEPITRHVVDNKLK